MQARSALFLVGLLMPAKTKNVIGPQIAQLRASKAMSQAEFAAYCQKNGWDISRETLAKIESGIRCVSDVELLEIAKSLQIPVPQLFPKNKQGLFGKIPKS